MYKCVYDFHHINREEKDKNISTLINLSLDAFWEEINKCELLCANCHRMEHNTYEEG